MPLGSGLALLTLIILLVGSGVFVRIVAKEKYRRDRSIERMAQERQRQLDALHMVRSELETERRRNQARERRRAQGVRETAATATVESPSGG